MDKLIEFINSFGDLNLKELIFRKLNYLPFLVGALVLVLFLTWLIKLKSKRRPSLGVSSLAFFEKKKLFWRRLPGYLFILGIIILILANLDPVSPLTKNKKKIEAKKIMIILDFSESMTHIWSGGNGEKTEETKLDVERKHVIRFIEARKDDLIGLIVYSENSYISPLTTAHQNLIMTLKLFRIYPRGTAHKTWATIIPGEAYTATGDALFAADAYLKKYGGEGEKIIVLFTDGVKNKGREPEEAFEEIKTLGFKLVILGVDFSGYGAKQLANNAKEITGAQYFSVDTEEDFRKAVNFIDKQTGKNRMIVDEYIVDEPKYFYFAFIALALFILVLCLKHLHYFRDLL